MKTGKQKKQLSVLMRGMILSAVVMVVGIALVASVLLSAQRRTAVRLTQRGLARSLDEVIEMLDTNTEEVDALSERVHRDNQAIVNNLAELIFHPNYSSISGPARADRSVDLSAFSEMVGGNGELFVLDEDGYIKYASSPKRIGLHLEKDGILTREQAEHLQRNEQGEDHSYSGTYVEATDPSGSVLLGSDPVSGKFGETGKAAYFYSNVQPDGETLVLETHTAALNTLLENIGDIATVLSGAVMENEVFFAAVDPDGVFAYFDDGDTVLTGKAYTESGLTADILAERYHGLQKIGGSDYQCRTRSYSSALYGDDLLLIAASPDKFVSRENFITSILTITVFIGIAVIIMLYTMFLKVDPEQMVGYDEKVLKAKGKKRRKAIRKDFSLRNAEAFKLFGKQYYFKVGIAKRIAPVIVLGLAIILFVSWNAQRVTMITKNMMSADVAMERLESLFETSNGNTQILTAAYEQHYLLRLKLVSQLVQTDPDALNGKTDSTFGDDVVYTYLDDKFNPVVDANGKPITSVSNASGLKKLAKQNGIDEIYIFDDHGHIIASGNDLWKFTLSTDQKDQSYEFRKILTGETTEIIQEPMLNDIGNARQYMGTTLYYYTLQGKGAHDGRYVSKSAYDSYLAEGVYDYENESYEVVCHRGMIQAGISDTRINRIMESTTPSYLMQQFEVGQGGYAMIFDNTEEHNCLWSPVNSDIGKNAKALGISDNGFSGYYKGFSKQGGTKYLQYIKYDNNNWVALNMPEQAVFAGGLRAALFATLISAVFYLIMFFFCSVTNEDEEVALEAKLEEMVEKEEDISMFKVTMPNGKVKYVRSSAVKSHRHNPGWKGLTVNQKMSRLTSVIATVLGAAVIAVTIFEQKIFGPLSAFHYILTGNWDKGLNYFACFYCVIVLIYIAVIASAVSLFVSFIIRNMGSRVETIGRLLLSVIKYGSVLFGIFYAMTLLGISTSGVVTSAGILSVVVGLGAQSLISDILSGIFIIFEGSFKVGDIVEIHDFCGYVREIGIRTTLVESYIGDIKIFNNSQISGILNHTMKDSYVLCKVGISYNEDIERVERVFAQNLPKIKHKIPGLIGELRYSGVFKLDDSAVIIGVGGRCHEGEKRFFLRRLQREILILFRDNHINIPFPQMTISYEKEEPHPEHAEHSDVWEKNSDQAEKFINESFQDGMG